MLVANPNLTIDRTLDIDEIRPGEVLRFTEARITPGGKGVNVGRVARALDAPARLVCLLPGHTGEALARMLADEILHVRGVPCDGEARCSLIIFERSGRVTVLNEPGPPVGAGEWERYEQAVAEELAPHEVLVCTGSAPPGTPPDGYGRLVGIAHDLGRQAIVDATGALLEGALAFAPDVVVPNLGEAESVLHGRADEAVEVDPQGARDRAETAAAGLVERGARTGIVTAGAAGVAMAGRDGAKRWIDSLEVTVRNPIGAGDSFAAGLAIALERGRDLDDALGCGVATAAASIESLLAGGVDADRVEKLTDVLRARGDDAP